MNKISKTITELDNDKDVSLDDCLLLVQHMIKKIHKISVPMNIIRKRYRDIKEGLEVPVSF